MPCIYSVVIFKPHQEELHIFSDIISTCVLVVHQLLEWLEVMWLKYILIINQVLWFCNFESSSQFIFKKEKSEMTSLFFSLFKLWWRLLLLLYWANGLFCIFIKTLFSMFIKLFPHSACEVGFYYPCGDIWSSIAGKTWPTHIQYWICLYS